jgi:hypothetical protein
MRGGAFLPFPMDDPPPWTDFYPHWYQDLMEMHHMGGRLLVVFGVMRVSV